MKDFNKAGFAIRSPHGRDSCRVNSGETTEIGGGEIHVTGDVSPGETVTITRTDGLVDADVTVNGESVAPTEADGEIEVIESEQANHNISHTGSETGTEMRSSTSSSESSTTVSTSTSTSTST